MLASDARIADDIRGSDRTPGGSPGLQNQGGAVHAVSGGFDSHPLPFVLAISIQVSNGVFGEEAWTAL